MGIRVERVYFSLSVQLTLGEDIEFEIVNEADVEFTPDRIVTSAPCPEFVRLTAVTLEDIDVLGGTMDAFAFSALNSLNIGPSIPPERRKLAGPTKPTRVTGIYTGLVPPDGRAGEKMPFIVRLSGFHPEPLKRIEFLGDEN